MVESCSLTDETQKVREIKTANKGADMKKIFNDDQEDFLLKASIEVSWKRLTPFGPVEGVKVWKGRAWIRSPRSAGSCRSVQENRNGSYLRYQLKCP